MLREGHCESELPLRLLLAVAELTLHIVDIKQHLLNALKVGLPGFCQTDTARSAPKQTRTELFFQSCDILADQLR